MRLPEVLAVHGVTRRAVGCPVVNQPADDAKTPVGVTLFEQERVRREISVQLDFTGTERVLLS